MNREHALNHAIETVAQSNFCILSYLNKGGYPVTKAMNMPRKKDSIRTFWFSTNTDSNKVRSYEQDQKACLYFLNSSSFIGVSLVGEVTLLSDTESKHEIWQDGDEVFYPNGIDGNDYIVMRFDTKYAEVYANFETLKLVP